MTTEPLRWTFTSPGLPPTPNNRLHWAARQRVCGPLRDALAWEVRACHPPRLAHARVTVTLYRTSGRQRDTDNAYASVIPLINGLVLGGILTDDDPAHMDLLVVQERGPTRCVRLVVEEVG